MMLMSYAGPTLSRCDLLPTGIDWDMMTEHTTEEVQVLGLWNLAIRPENLDWNAETQRVCGIATWTRMVAAATT